MICSNKGGIIIKKVRNEWKYSCSAREADRINNRLSAILNKDAHSDKNGSYQVHTLYFDDYKNSCVRENDAGVAKRVKYRIRYYGNQYSTMKLERKEKINGYCYKQSCRISLAEYLMIMDGKANELIWQTEELLLKWFCICCMTRNFVPKAIIDYERTAYIEEISNIRVTLDANISVSDDFSRFLEGDYIRYPVQGKEEKILEVKFDDILPSYIKNTITNRRMIPSAFSKYCVGRKNLQNRGR